MSYINKFINNMIGEWYLLIATPPANTLDKIAVTQLAIIVTIRSDYSFP